MMIDLKNEGLEVVAWRIGFPNNTGYKVYGQRQPWAYEKYGVPSVIVCEVQELCRHSEALAGYAARDARIAELELPYTKMCERMWELESERDQLRAELAALNAKLDAPVAKQDNEDLKRAWQAGHDTAWYGKNPAHERGYVPVAKQVVMQSTNFTASNGEQRNPRYQGQFEGETHDQAAYRHHWVTAAIESERLNAAPAAPAADAGVNSHD